MHYLLEFWYLISMLKSFPYFVWYLFSFVQMCYLDSLLFALPSYMHCLEKWDAACQGFEFRPVQWHTLSSEAVVLLYRSTRFVFLDGPCTCQNDLESYQVFLDGYDFDYHFQDELRHHKISRNFPSMSNKIYLQNSSIVCTLYSSSPLRSMANLEQFCIL